MVPFQLRRTSEVARVPAEFARSGRRRFNSVIGGEQGAVRTGRAHFDPPATDRVKVKRPSPAITEASPGVDPCMIGREQRALQRILPGQHIDEILVVPDRRPGAVLQGGGVLGKELPDQPDFFLRSRRRIGKLVRQR